MSKYNLNDHFDPNEEYSLKDLSGEIFYEYVIERGKFKDLNQDKTSIKRQLKNDDKTGVIDRIAKHLNFNIYDYSKAIPKKEFEMFQLAKYIYSMEEYGIIQGVNEENIYRIRKIPIINILSKPRLDNIESIISNESEYGKYTRPILDQLHDLVDSQDEILGRLNRANLSWKENIDIFKWNYTACDNAIKNKNKYLEILKTVNDFLENKLLPLLKEFNRPDYYSRDVLEIFYTIVICHNYLSRDNEYLKINAYEIEGVVTEEYTELFSKLEFKILPPDIAEKTILYLKNKSEYNDEEVKNIVSAIKTGAVQCSDKDMIYALERVAQLIHIVEIIKKVSFEDGIDASLFVAMIQEIIFVKNNKVSILNDPLGFTTGNKSLKTILNKKPLSTNDNKLFSEPAIVLLAWEKRIVNRLAINFGYSETMIETQKSELLMYQLKKKIFSFLDYDKIFCVSEIMNGLIDGLSSFDFDGEKNINHVLNKTEELLKIIFNGKNVTQKI